MGNNFIIGLTFVIYFVVVLIIGAIAYIKTKNLSDYILGDRKIGAIVAALSAEASDMSGWLLLGLPGYAYIAGLNAGWIALGLLIGTYCNWLLVAPKLRAHPAAIGESLTLADYFEKRFNDKSRLIRIITAFFILVFFTFYTSSGFVAGGKLFSSVFGINYFWAVLIGAASILVYTFLGGFLAVCWTDCFQGMLMFFALIIVPTVTIEINGGWIATETTIKSVSKFLLNPFRLTDGNAIGIIAIVSLMGWGLGYFGQPHILARFMAIRSPDQMPAARRIAMGWVSLTLLGAVLVGLAGIAFFPNYLQGPESEKIFIKLVEAILHPIPAGICLAAILAAIMSTADSQLLVSSAAFAEDFYKPFINKKASQKELILVGRLAVLTIAGIAILLALNPNNKVLDLVAYAWAGFGASFGPTILFSLYYPAMTRNAALGGIIIGGLTVIIWKQFKGGIFDLYEMVPAFIFSSIAIILISVIENKLKSMKDDTKEREFEGN